MNRIMIGTALLLAACATTARGQTARLSWMSGCWELKTGTRVVTEQWSVPRAGTMLGAGHTTRNDSTFEFEHTRIYDDESGGTRYAAAPSGQSAATFTALAVNDTIALFENRAHDFPQRIQYVRSAPDSLVARIEGTINGKARGVDFRYRRTSCTP